MRSIEERTPRRRLCDGPDPHEQPGGLGLLLDAEWSIWSMTVETPDRLRLWQKRPRISGTLCGVRRQRCGVVKERAKGLRGWALWGVVAMGCHHTSGLKPEMASRVAADIPEDAGALDAWVAQQERRYTDLVPGTQKFIRRVSEERTPVSVVYVHGYGASRQEVSPLCETVADEIGANLFMTRLRGHGRGPEGFRDASPEAWMADTVEAMEIGRRLGEAVVLIGVSTGATLVSWMAAQQPKDLAATVLISPNFGIQSGPELLLVTPGRRLLFRMVFGKYRVWEPRNEGERTYWTWTQPPEALFSMIETIRYVRDETDLSAVVAPSLYVYSDGDQVVDHERGLETFARMGAAMKETHRVTSPGDPYGHILAGDIIAPGDTAAMAERLVAFVQVARGEQ